MKTFIRNFTDSKTFFNPMVIPLTFLISVFAYFWIRFSFQGHCLTMSPKTFCISVFLSLALTLLKSVHKFLVFVRPSFPTSTFVSSFVEPSVFSIFSPLRTEFPKVWGVVLAILLRVNAVPHCMWVKRLAIYTQESKIIWKSLPLLPKNVLILHRLAFCPILPKLATRNLLTISKLFLLAIQPLNFW